MSPKILLLQARNPDDTAKYEERESFAKRAGLEVEQFVPHDLLSGPPPIKKVRSYDAIMVGGSGDYYVSKKNLPKFTETLDLLREVVAQSHPTFASCFGFQLLAKALGGEVILDSPHTEVGTYSAWLTDAGKNDELLGSLPAQFSAQLGRKDRASQLPDTCIHLAASKRCPYQAFRVQGKPIWATQFHPELNRADNLARFVRYQKGYGAVMSKDEQDAAFNRFQDSPETETLIPRFLKLVFGQKEVGSKE